MPRRTVLDETATARRFFSKITSRSVLHGKMPLTLMAIRTSEYKQRCLSHVSRLNTIRQSSLVAKRLWFGYVTPINNTAPHQSIVYLGVAKSFASARTWTRIAIFIECLKIGQAELSQRRNWASWMLEDSDRWRVQTLILLDI